jgi:acetoin utilization protein AcuB
MNVSKRYSSPVITVEPELPISEALEKMRREKIRHMPVLRKGKLVGIVTRNDLLNASPSKATTLSVWEINYLLNKITVADVMSKNVITVPEDTPIEEAARLMADHKVSCLPVLRGKELAGIITETDLFKIFLELLGARRKGVRLTVQVTDKPGVLAGISQAIFAAGGNIIALGTFAGDTRASPLITIKLDGLPVKTVRKIVEPLVTRLVDLREL